MVYNHAEARGVSFDVGVKKQRHMAKIRWCTCRPPRRPTAVVGACTTLFVGAVLFNRLFLNNAATCIANCSTAIMYRSYERMQKNEASKRVKHPGIKTFEVNFLGSNSPIEDRFVTGFSTSLGIGVFSVIDGHKGYRCSNFIQNHVLQFITSALSKAVGTFRSDLEICMTMNSTGELNLDWKPIQSIPLPMVEECLTSSFAALEDHICSGALSDVQLVLQGHSMTPDMKERIMRAIEGACVSLAVVQTDTISIATTGDCRVVLGREQVDHSWQALPLSVDQNAMNTKEVERLKNAHPGEENVVLNGRVLGSLMPFRTFGDVDFKWDMKFLKGLVPVWPNYKTPPYISAEPVVTHHKRIEGDRFMVIASDGLWERLSNEDVVQIVADSLKQETNQERYFSLFRYFGWGRGTGCCPPNAATQLLWHALGGTDQDVTKLLDVPPSYSRMVRDDITIIVVFFN